MKYRITLGLILILQLTCFAQYKNNIWLWGESGNPPLPYGGAKMEIINNFRTISAEQHNMFFSDCYSGLSDKNDNWFVYSNGSAICNKNNDTLVNGIGLSMVNNIWAYTGLPLPALCVLFPGDTVNNLHYIFHANAFGGSLPHSLQLYYSVIDPIAANGRGEVISKNNLIINDSLDAGNILALRHANGRDWWVIAKRFRMNKFYSILVTPDSVYAPNSFNTQAPPSRLGGQACITPDGSLYASFSNTASQLEIYDFDRCTGMLNNYKRKFITNNMAGFTSFSPNSRFLYIASIDTLWQLDMQAPDVLASQTFIAKYDGFVDSTFNNQTAFWWHWLAPDGKIYIVSSSQARVLHVINNPDMPGSACDFQQHSVSIPTVNNWTTPSSINLALYHLPGSPCDTLGVGNPKLEITNSVLKITPNPNDGIFGVEYIPQRKSGMLYLYDITGKEVYKEYVSPYSSIKNFDLSQQLKNGMYAISLVFDSNTLTQKIIIQKE
jgi:hypothetical protein